MRKVLSFVLVLSLVLGSFSMAFAATPASGLSDIAGITNEDAIQVNYDLGIVTGNPDGTFLPTKAVTRAEFAAMITRALAIPESAIAGYTTSSFKDTVGYGWAVPYLAFCQSKGIMLGDGAGNAMPGRTISTNEAMTMVLRAIGYTANSAKLVGSWPSNYVTIAQNEGLYDDVAAVVNVDKANAAQIIYNALTVQKVAVNSDGETKFLDNGKTGTDYVAYNMLNTGLNCSSTKEVVSFDNDALVNTTKFVGAWAEVYKNKDGDIVAIKPISTFLTGKFKAGDYGTFKADGVEYTFKPTSTTVASINNAKVTVATSTSTVAAVTADNTTVTLAVKVSGKTITDVYSVAKWTVTKHDKVASSDLATLKNEKLLGKEFYKDNDGEIDAKAFQLVGVKTVNDIKADNIVYVYTLNNESSSKIVKVAVGTEVVEGMVQSYNSKDDEFKINGKTYANSGTTGDADDSIAASNVANEVKVWLDGYGEGYTFEVTKGQANNYAVVTGANNTSGYDNIVKLVTADGSSKSYTFDMDEVTSTTAALGQIVGYSLDKDGVIDGFANAITGTTKACITLDSSDGLIVNNTKALKYGNGSPSSSAVIASDVVVFTYAKGGASGTNFAGIGDVKVSSIDKVKTGENIVVASAAALYLDKDGKVVAMLIPAAKATKSDDSLYAVINGVSATANSDNDKVFELTGWANGAEFTKLTDGKNVETGFGTYIQLYKLGTDANGTINSVKLVGTAYDSTAASTAFSSTSGVVVKSAGSGYIKVSTGALGFNNGEVIAISSNAKYYEVTYDGASIDEYTDFSGTPAEGDMVWVFDTDDDADGYDVVIVKVAE